MQLFLCYFSCMANFKSVGNVVSILYRYTQIYLKETLSDLDLHGSGQIKIVLTLSKHPEGLSQDKLARILIVDKATVSKMIRPLVQNGMVERSVNPDDKRAYIVKLSEKALANVPEIKRRTGRWTQLMSRNIPPERMDGFFETMEIMLKNAADYLKEGNIEKS